MDFTTFFIVLFGLQAICLYVGSRSTKDLNTQEDYFLAGKGVKFFPLMMTFLATQIGGGLVLGSAEEAFRYGWSVLLYPGGAALGLILLGLGLGRRLAQFKVTTIAQILEVVYGSAFLKRIASVLSVLTLFMIFVAQIIGSSKFMVSLGVESRLWFFAFWAIVIFYTAVGGLKAVVATDVIQALFFIAIFVLCGGYALYSNGISLQEVVSIGMDNDSFSFDPSKLYGWLLMPLMFMAIEQDMGQRCFAADCPRTVSRATLWAGLGTLFIGVIPVMFGILARARGIEAGEGASVLMLSIMTMTNPVITAFVGCAILAAIISTADSLINAIGSNLSQDFGWALFDGKNVRASQIVSVAIALLGIAVSFYFNNIVDLLILSYELSVSALFVPIFIGLFRPKGSFLSALVSILFGGIAFFCFKYSETTLPKEILTVIIALLGFVIGEVVASLRRGVVAEKQVSN